MKRVIRQVSVLVSLLLLVGSVQAVTQAQLEQLRELPRAQQEALAREHGVDLDNLEGRSAPRESRPEEVRVVETPLSEPERDRRERAEDELRPFGYELFQGRPTTFAPVTEIPLPAEYVIGPGDVIRLQLYGKENDLLELPVTRDGVIQLPDSGPMPVAGLTLEELKEVLGREVRERYIGTEASISISELRSMRVFVLGEARSPGSYTVSSLSTLTNALFVSGGISESGSLRNVQLKRDGEVVGTLDLYELLLSGDTAADQRLQPGDAIFIPPVGETVAVTGEVRRPAIYELKGGETLEDIIGMAGGYTPDAAPAHTRLERVRERRKRALESVDLTTEADRLLDVEDGDRVTVRALQELRDGFVRTRGAVTRPGSHEWREGMRISDIIGSRQDDLRDDVDLNYGLIVREVDESERISVHQFRPLEVLGAAGSEADPVLEERDKVLIFSRRSAPEDGAGSQRGGRHDSVVDQEISGQGAGVRSGERGGQAVESGGFADRERDEADASERAWRRQLLAPVIEHLEAQASPEEPLQVVSVTGSVRHPGDYPLPEGASAEDMIRAAGGLRDSALMLETEITRVSVTADGEAETQLLTFPLVAGMDTGAADIKMHGRDRLLIKKVPGFAQRDTVTLEGEVRFPGEYTVRPDDTLRDLIERAGGLTERAFPEGAVFSRQRLRELERERLADAERRLRRDLVGLQLDAENGASAEDLGALQRLLDDVQRAEAAGRLVIDLEAILAGAVQPVEVVEGDRLRVPRRPQSVSVFGEVQFASSHLYDGGLTVSDYLDRSGGLTSQADSERVYVVRADGSVWRPDRSRWYAGRGENLRPGDTIVAPMDVDRINQLQLWTNVSQVFSNLAVSAAALRSF